VHVSRVYVASHLCVHVSRVYIRRLPRVCARVSCKRTSPPTSVCTCLVLTSPLTCVCTCVIHTPLTCVCTCLVYTSPLTCTHRLPRVYARVQAAETWPFSPLQLLPLVALPYAATYLRISAAWVRADAQTYKHTYIHTYTHTYVRTFDMYACMRTHGSLCPTPPLTSASRPHGYVEAYMGTSVCIRTYVHAYTHTYVTYV
jgi:hypothetical protein